jgi:ABC-type multidrug transport system ATPase subunit
MANHVMLGYCPQFDALIDTMTAREHLLFYCRIKGVPEAEVFEYTEAMIKQLGLTEFADQPSKGYSGGNKRKLSVGIALVGMTFVVHALFFFGSSSPIHTCRQPSYCFPG